MIKKKDVSMIDSFKRIKLNAGTRAGISVSSRSLVLRVSLRSENNDRHWSLIFTLP